VSLLLAPGCRFKIWSPELEKTAQAVQSSKKLREKAVVTILLLAIPPP
jgi:hypothetical protein